MIERRGFFLFLDKNLWLIFDRVLSDECSFLIHGNLFFLKLFEITDVLNLDLKGSRNLARVQY